MTRQVTLSLEQVALVDDDDYPELAKYEWKAMRGRHCFYAVRKVYVQLDEQRIRKTLLMHRVILGIEDDPDIKIDHVDRDGLNNTRENLRIATASENQWNRGTDVDKKTSRYKGVYWNKERQKWHVQIGYMNKVIYIGRYDTEEAAAIAYNEAALYLHGEFAVLNELKPPDWKPANITELVDAQRY